MNKYSYRYFFIIVFCLLSSCSFNTEKLGYELEDRQSEYIHNEIEEDITIASDEEDVVIDRPVNYEPAVSAEEDYIAYNQYVINDDLLTMVYSNSRFSIRYPSTWEIVQQNSRTLDNTIIAVQIMQIAENDVDFLPNINIIISKDKHAETTTSMARLSLSHAKQAGLTSNLIGIRECSINGYSGSVAECIGNLEGYKLHYYQYIVKKNDDTTFIITMTLDHNNLTAQKKVAQQIIHSIKIF